MKQIASFLSFLLISYLLMGTVSFQLKASQSASSTTIADQEPVPSPRKKSRSIKTESETDSNSSSENYSEYDYSEHSGSYASSSSLQKRPERKKRAQQLVDSPSVKKVVGQVATSSNDSFNSDATLQKPLSDERSLSQTSYRGASTYDSDDDVDASEQQITPAELAFEVPRIQRHILHWLIHSSPESQATLANKSVTTVRYRSRPDFQVKEGAHYRSVAKMVRNALSLTNKPLHTSEDEASSIPHHEVAVHMMTSSFDTPPIRERFQKLLKDDPSVIASVGLYDAQTAGTLYNFYLSYFDLPSTHRIFKKEGSKIVPQKKESLLGDLDAKIPQASQLLREEQAQTAFWQPYKKACLIAAALHHPEAVETVLAHRELFQPITLPRHYLTQEAHKARHQKRFQQALSLTRQLINDTIEEYRVITFAGRKELGAALLTMNKAYYETQGAGFGEKKSETQKEKYLNLQQAVLELTRLCSSHKKLMTTGEDYLTNASKIINKIIAVTLTSCAQATNDFKVAARASTLGEALPQGSALYETIQNFFTHYPGIPPAKDFLCAYQVLIKGAQEKESEDVQEKMYRCAHDCARTFYTLQGDTASSSDLFSVYREFLNYAKKNSKKEATSSECMAIADYYLFKGKDCLRRETDAHLTLDSIKAGARQLHLQANCSSEPPLLRDALYEAAERLVLKRVNLLLPEAQEDRLWLCELYFSHATCSPSPLKKKALNEQALKVAELTLQGQSSSGESASSSGPFVSRAQDGTRAAFVAGLYYVVALKKVFAGSTFEDPYLKTYEPFIFSHDTDAPFIYDLPEESSTFLYDRKTRTIYIRRSVECALVMIKALKDRASLPHHMLLIQTVRAALELHNHELPDLETYLEEQFKSLERVGTVELPDQNKPALYKALAEDYFKIARLSSNKKRVALALRGALFCWQHAYKLLGTIEENEYVEFVEKLFSWADSEHDSLVFPPKLLGHLFNMVVNATTAFIGSSATGLSEDQTALVSMRLKRALSNPSFKRISFGSLFPIAEYFFKAAWLGKDTGLMQQYLINAGRYLEVILTGFPTESWPTHELYHLLGLSFRKAAFMSTAESTLQEDLQAKATFYLQKAEGLAGAVKTITQDFPELVPFTDESMNFSNPDVAASLKPFYRFIKSFTGRLKRIPDVFGVIVDESDSSDDSLTSSESEEVKTEEFQKLTTELDDYSLAQLSVDESCKDNDDDNGTQQKLGVLVTQSKEIGSFKLAMRLGTLPQAHDALFRSFLTHFIDTPSSQRIFSRSRTSFKTAKKIMGPSHTYSRYYLAWPEHLNKLLALAFVGHLPARIMLKQGLKSLSDEDCYLFMFPFFKEVEISRDQAVELLFHLRLGDFDPALMRLKDFLRADAHKATLEKLIAQSKMNRKELPPDLQLAPTLEGYKSLARHTADFAGTVHSDEPFILYQTALKYLEQFIDLTIQGAGTFPEEADYRDLYRTICLARRQLSLPNSKISSETRHEFIQMSTRHFCSFVDLQGEAASSHDLTTAFEETMAAIQDLEDQVTELFKESLPGSLTRKNGHRTLKKKQLELFNYAVSYHTAAQRLEGTDPFLIAQTLRNRARGASRGEENAYPATQTFLLKLAALSLKAGIEAPDTIPTNAQFTELSETCKLGYQKARAAGFPVLQAQLLKVFLTTESQRQTFQRMTSTTKANLVKLIFHYFSKSLGEDIQSLYAKATLLLNGASSITNYEEAYETYCHASDLCLLMYDKCVAHQELTGVETFSFMKEGEPIQCSLSWVQSFVLTTLLETAKHAPDDEKALELLARVLKYLDVPHKYTAQQGNPTLWKEILKAVFRKKIQENSLKDSKHSQSTSFIARVTEIEEVGSPFNSHNPSPVNSPRRNVVGIPLQDVHSTDPADQMGSPRGDNLTSHGQDSSDLMLTSTSQRAMSSSKIALARSKSGQKSTPPPSSSPGSLQRSPLRVSSSSITPPSEGSSHRAKTPGAESRKQKVLHSSFTLEEQLSEEQPSAMSSQRAKSQGPLVGRKASSPSLTLEKAPISEAQTSSQQFTSGPAQDSPPKQVIKVKVRRRKGTKEGGRLEKNIGELLAQTGIPSPRPSTLNQNL